MDDTTYYFIREGNDEGVALRREGELEEAISRYDRVLSIKGDAAVVYNNRGEVRRKMQNYELAIEDYSRALQINPHFAVVYYNRGLAWCALNLPDRAYEDFTRAQELNRALLKTHVQLVKALKSGAMDRVCRAAEDPSPPSGL
jgi:tetratricopeptide (TPR) repeat protein